MELLNDSDFITKLDDYFYGDYTRLFASKKVKKDEIIKRIERRILNPFHSKYVMSKQSL